MKLHCVALLLLLSLPLAAQESKPLPPWSRGTLDIHQISTGRGNAAFYVFPDGTTMLVDAGAVGDDTTGAKIARYIERMMAPEKPRLDYALITHYHADHLAGLPGVGSSIPIGTLIDRGTSYLPPPDDAMMKAFRAFIADKNVKEEPIRVGANDQIVLRREPDAFKSFEVRWRPRWRASSDRPTCTSRITTARSIRRARSFSPPSARRSSSSPPGRRRIRRKTRSSGCSPAASTPVRTTSSRRRCTTRRRRASAHASIS